MRHRLTRRLTSSRAVAVRCEGGRSFHSKNSRRGSRKCYHTGGDPQAITISGYSRASRRRTLSAIEHTPEDVIKGAIALRGPYDQEPRRPPFLIRIVSR